MSVETKHPLYTKRSHQWEIMRDCYEGEDAVKAKGEKYLPRMSGSADWQYRAYMKRARWINYVGRTLNGLHGLMFRRYPVLVCPDALRKSGILENVDRRGTGLDQFVADSVHDMMIPTFGGYLADMPEGGKMTKEEAEIRQIRPFVRYYAAESIINWKYDYTDGIERLSLVVLKELTEKWNDDEFAHDTAFRYRVLEIKDGVYRQRIFEPLGEKDGKQVFDEKVIPVVINGYSLDYIPFVFAPSRLPDRPMLMDLAYCNIGHYQKSADYENGVHLTTIPTGYVTGHGQTTGTDEKEVINLGGDSFLTFPEENARVGTLVFAGEGLTHSETALAMAAGEMAVLGSRLISPDKNVSETADAAKIHRAGENALLATFAKNVSDCITKVLEIICSWIGAEGECRYELTTDYDTLAVDANVINALANISDKGKMPDFYVFENLKNGEYLPKDATLEEYVTLLQMERLGIDPITRYAAYRLMKNGQSIDWSLMEKKAAETQKNGGKTEKTDVSDGNSADEEEI